jgi:hypothetical protein
MNGEPRAASDTPELNSTTDGATSAIPGDRRLLEPVSIEGVTQSALPREETRLAPLFSQPVASDFRSRWDMVQRSFVDNPQEAVHAGDELVAQVITTLAESFSSQRSQVEVELNQSTQTSTENLRLALRRYRSFFERLLSI